MAVFKYEIRNKRGEIEKSSIAAVSYDHAAKKLVGMGADVIKLQEDKGSFLEKILKVKPRDVILFTRGLATLQKAGVPLLQSLNSLTDMTSNAKMRRIQQDITMAVESGINLSGALAKFPEVFRKLYVAMIRVAEASGSLDKVLDKLCKNDERDEELRSQLKSAMAYPTVVCLAISGIIFFILTFVVPQFTKVFENVGVGMPTATRMLIKFSDIIKTKSFIIIPAIITVFVALSRIVKIGVIKVGYDAFKLRLPLVGGLLQKILLARFAKGLQILLESGVPILESLELVGSALENEVVASDIKQMSRHIAAGGNMTEFIKLKKMFPSLVVQMISVGEETGTLSKMLAEVADFYENETQRAIKTLLTMLEPIMIVVMGLLVGGILITLMMPLFGMMKGFGV